MKEGTGAKPTAEALFKVLKNFSSDKTVKAVVCDNTPVNTGHAGGAVVLLEKMLGRKLHKIGCLLHFNELPLRQVIKQLDGPTAAGDRWTGPVGQRLHDNIYLETPVKFQPVASPLQRPSEDILSDMSNDQRLLLEYVLAINSGTIPNRFVYHKPGPAVQSRWLTTAIRIQIIYTRTSEPTPELLRIVTFIQQVYAPGWFLIKQKNNFVEGPKLIYDILQAALQLNDPECCKIVQDKIQHWAFPLLSENFLASLLYSDRQFDRRMAAVRITQLREAPPKLTADKIKPVNFAASHWSNLISIITTDTEPPLTVGLSLEDVEALVEQPGECPVRFPLHSQVS